MAHANTCPELTVDEVAELMADRRALVIDVNPRRRWSSGHLPGAINLDPGDLTANDLPEHKETPLIFYCSDAGGGASRFAAQKAARMGFTNVFIMPAGIRGWMAARLPVEAGR